MANILITGASGFLGANLARRLSDSNNRISVFLHKRTNLWRIREIISKLDVQMVDLTDSDAIKKTVKQTKPEIVFHLATYGVYSYQDNYRKIIDTNVTGSANLMSELSNCDSIKKFVNLGSSFEYGPKLRKIEESDHIEPDSVYGISKATQTNLAQYFAKYKNLPAITLRIFNAYGMFEEKNRLIPSIMLSALTKKPLHIRNPKERRDFIFVNDVVDSMLKASKLKKSGIVLNIGMGTGYSVEQIIRKSLVATNCDIRVVFENKVKDKNPGNIVADIDEARKILGWEPKFSIDEGLNETFNWFKQNIRLYGAAKPKQ